MKNSKELEGLKSCEGKKISRKDALKKAGFIAFSAASMMLLLNNTTQAQGTESPAWMPDPTDFD